MSAEANPKLALRQFVADCEKVGQDHRDPAHYCF